MDLQYLDHTHHKPMNSQSFGVVVVGVVPGEAVYERERERKRERERERERKKDL